MHDIGPVLGNAQRVGRGGNDRRFQFQCGQFAGGGNVSATRIVAADARSRSECRTGGRIGSKRGRGSNRGGGLSSLAGVSHRALRVLPLPVDWDQLSRLRAAVRKASRGAQRLEWPRASGDGGRGMPQHGIPVDLERSVRLEDRLGGHLVQGHTDGTGTIQERVSHQDWDVVRISLPPDLARYVVHKGSITVDGISLTVSAMRITRSRSASSPKRSSAPRWAPNSPVTRSTLKST